MKKTQEMQQVVFLCFKYFLSCLTDDGGSYRTPAAFASDLSFLLSL